MKKLFTAIVAILMAAPTFAQYSSGGFSLEKENLYYGARIGLTSAGIGGDEGIGSKVGMTLGGVIGLRVSSTTPVFLESGLYYTERGGKKDKLTTSLNYFEIPILIKYGIKATDEIAILPFVGPYFSYAISGRTKMKGDEDWSSFNETHEYNGKTYGGYKHADMGFKLGCGAEYNKLYLELGYQFGVADISSYEALTKHGHAFFMNFGINF